MKRCFPEVVWDIDGGTGSKQKTAYLVCVSTGPFKTVSTNVARGVTIKESNEKKRRNPTQEFK
jgi:hypothetical protein